MSFCVRAGFLCAFLGLLHLQTHAGGSGLNIVVVVNTNSANSLQLGNYYCEKRGVPPQNVLRIGWSGSVVTWTRASFESTLRAPLNSMLTSRGLSNQVDFVLLSMDIPYRVGDDGGVATSGTNSTTSALFYGFKPDGDCPFCGGYPGCSLPLGSENAYAGSEGIFRQTPPNSAPSNSWFTMMLTSSNLAQAKLLVDRGVASDFQFPTQTNWLVKTSDAFRNIRYLTFDDAMFDCQVLGASRVKRANSDSLEALGYQLGAQFALYWYYNLPPTPTLFAPGGLADSLTSYGGYIFDPVGHKHALEFLIAGANASYGTIVEPCGYLAKFPSPRNYFYQSRGFTAVESYFMSVTNPYQGILVGEPLSAPFAKPGSIAWAGLPAGSLLVGTTNLTLNASAADATHPVRQVDLFVDGKFATTISTINPSQNNVIYVTIRGQTTNYVVPNPLIASLKNIAIGLASAINGAGMSNLTLVSASPRSDRVELKLNDITAAAESVAVSISNSIGSASSLTTFASPARSNFLSTPAFGFKNFFITNYPTPGSYLQLNLTKTNGALTTVSVTNPPGNTDASIVVSNLVNAINATPALASADGVVAEDFFSYDYWYGWKAGEFNLRSRTAGWRQAQIQAEIVSSGFQVFTSASQPLDDNATDFPGRNHIYITAGATNMPLVYGFNTTAFADGWHELTAVAYEGSHVRTQARASQTVRIQNTPFAATFTSLLAGSNTALNATMQFQVVANTNNASMNRIELFSTGGQWGVVSNNATANFSIVAYNLHLGLHPVYAIATRNDGKQYRTDTKWIRIVDTEPVFGLKVISSTPTLSWPATAGRRYEILSATNVTDAYTLRDAVVPTNSSGLWSETNSASPRRFYKALAIP